METTPIKIEKISSEKFKSYVMFSRSPITSMFSEELLYFANEDESLLGTIVLDYTDRDFGSMILCRDLIGRFRAMDFKVSFTSIEEAIDWLIRKMKWHTGKGIKVFPQRDEPKKVDLFKPIVSKRKEHPYFTRLNSDESFIPAKTIINEIFPYFNDIDGNFVEQFQSTGFDSRVWELYLFCYFTEEELFLKREYDRPDFMVQSGEKEVAIEAVTVGRKKDNPPRYLNLKEDFRPNKKMDKELADAMPIRFGSPLYSKLKKEYWKLPHVLGKPLIIAIADFHDDYSMTWSHPAIIDYLYGLKFDHHYDEKGNLVINSSPIAIHKLGPKEIPSGYFNQPDVENISGILFSAIGTLSKFNRIGRQAGLGDSNIFQLRVGERHDHDPNASVPLHFAYQVGEDSTETWAEGVSIFHNPNAIHPIPKALFPSAAHHELVDGQIHSSLPDIHPYWSFTMNLKRK